ncbi:MAG: IS1595 family transposase [Actinomycetota bacterium]
MSTFPKTLQEAVLYYANPENCLATAIKFRWADGVACPHCGDMNPGFLTTRRIWKCRNKPCRKQFSAKVGTIFEDSPLGLDKWFVVLWMLVNAKNGVSSWEIHRAVGVTQKTAWFMLHRLRLALREEEEPFSGVVEADETFPGGKAKNMHFRQRKLKIRGRGMVGKAIVFGVLQRHPENKTSKDKHKVSLVNAKVIKSSKKSVIQPAVRAQVAPGSTLYTDALASYDGITEYVHETVNHVDEYVRGAVHTNGMENFWCLLKRCLIGTYVSVEAEHLGRYVDEEVYRFNQRKDNDSGRFQTAGPGIVGKRLTYKELIARPEGMGPRRGKGATPGWAVK